MRSLRSPPRTFRSHAISSILYQRGIYPPETFTRVEKYGLGMLVTKEDGLKNYLNNVLKQLKGTVLGALPSRSMLAPWPTSCADWLMTGTVEKLVVVITNIDTNDTVERWVFDIITDLPQAGYELPVSSPSRINGALSDLIACREAKEKPEKEIMGEIQAIIRQICASVTFLPLLDGPCSFDLLVYADNKVTTPLAWEESDPKYIANSQVVRLRSFSTKVRVHRPARPNSSCVLTGLFLADRSTKWTQWSPTRCRTSAVLLSQRCGWSE